GVFEMKPLWFFCAILIGKFVRFVIVSLIIMIYGPAIFHTMIEALHHHQNLMLILVGILSVLLVVYVLRKVFDGRRGTTFPVEED
ncbi:MAG: DedA family protein, partial [Edaphobacter sp.]